LRTSRPFFAPFAVKSFAVARARNHAAPQSVLPFTEPSQPENPAKLPEPGFLD
jgi:hypothetical protein